MANWFTNLFKTAAPIAVSTLAPGQSATTNVLLNNLLNGAVSQNSTTVAAPVAPTQEQLNEAKQAVIIAQTNYNTLLTQVQAVEAYQKIIQQGQQPDK